MKIQRAKKTQRLRNRRLYCFMAT